MARGKKKETALTPEEKLAQALVPDWEQPYKVPKNWCWVYLEKLYAVNPKNEADNSTLAAFIPMDRIAAGMTSEFTYEEQPWEQAKKGHTQFADGDVAFAKISPCFENRKSMILSELPNGIGGGTTELIVLRQPNVDQRYTFWFISDEQFIRGGIATYSGTVGQQRISMDYVKSYPVPLPPSAEQKRIVERIESLVAKLDEAKEKAQSVLDSFETRKAAILHQAFTGELTAKWRVEHGVEDENWHALTLGDLITAAKNGTTAKQNKEKNDYPVTRIETLQGGTLDFSRLGYIINPDTISLEDYYVAGDIAFSHINSAAHVGKTALIEANFLPLIHGMNLLRIRLNERCIPEYFVWYSRSADYKEQILQRINMAVNQVSINQKQLKTIPINVAKTQEQREIVRILDSLFAKEQQAKEAAEAVLEKIDLLKKSILARAFRGELGTNDPTEESAVELLKTIL